MRIIWSLPVRGERLDSNRGDIIRAKCLIEAIRSEGHEVNIVEDAAQPISAFTVSTYRKIVKHVLPKKVAFVIRDIGRWLQSRAHGKRVAEEALAKKAELIIETQVHFSCSGAIAANLTGLPLILDDCSPMSEVFLFGIGLPSLAKYILTQQSSAASLIVVSSKKIAEILVKEGINSDKIVVIPNGIYLEEFIRVDRIAVRKRLGISNKCVVGYVGSFQPWHNVELLVKAFSQLINEYPIHLILIGDGQNLKSTIKLSHSLDISNHITFFGAVDHSRVPELISSFDISVLPGTNEYGHPMKLFEYAAAGVASIAPDLPPVREVIQNGETGLLFPPDDIKSLTILLKRLINDNELRNRLGEQARKRVTSGASWSDRARTILSHIVRN